MANVMDAAKTSSHNILTISLELFLLITGCVEPRDLLSLRRVCRAANENIHDVFLTTWFAHRKAVPTNKHHLRRLYKIASSEKISCGVKKVTFVVDGGSREIKSEPTSQGEIATNADEVPIGSYSDLLVAIFTRFREQGKLKDVVICHAWSLKEPQSRARDRRGGYPVSVLIEAMAASDLKLPNLVVDQANHLCRTLTMSSANVVFSALKSLQIDSSESFAIAPFYVARLVQLIASASQLKFLVFNYWFVRDDPEDAWTEERVVAHRILQGKFPALKQLSIKGIAADFDTLVSFVRRHQELKTVLMDEVHLRDVRPAKYDAKFNGGSRIALREFVQGILDQEVGMGRVIGAMSCSVLQEGRKWSYSGRGLTPSPSGSVQEASLSDEDSLTDEDWLSGEDSLSDEEVEEDEVPIDISEVETT